MFLHVLTYDHIGKLDPNKYYRVYDMGNKSVVLVEIGVPLPIEQDKDRDHENAVAVNFLIYTLNRDAGVELFRMATVEPMRKLRR